MSTPEERQDWPSDETVEEAAKAMHAADTSAYAWDIAPWRETYRTLARAALSVVAPVLVSAQERVAELERACTAMQERMDRLDDERDSLAFRNVTEARIAELESSLRLCQEDRDTARAEAEKQTALREEVAREAWQLVAASRAQVVIPDDAADRFRTVIDNAPVSADLFVEDISDVADLLLAEVRQWVSGPSAGEPGWKGFAPRLSEALQPPTPAVPVPAEQGTPCACGHTAWAHGNQSGYPSSSDPCHAEMSDYMGAHECPCDRYRSAPFLDPTPAVPDTAPSARPTTELSTRVSDSVAGRSAGGARDTFVSPTADERREIPAWVETIEKFIAAVCRGVDADSTEGSPLWEWEPGELEDWALSIHAMTGPAVDALDAALAPAPAPDYNRHCTNCGARYVPITCTVCGAGPTTSLAAPTPVEGGER